jgi:hypothetical protein
VGRCGGRRGEVAQTVYTHVSKCKNNKIKERKEKTKREEFEDSQHIE